jgi:hypothetical protein
MAFGKKTKNEEGLMITCKDCAWKYPVLSEDTLPKINELFKEHKCTEFPAVEQNIELSKLTEKEILIQILVEFKKRN